MASKFYVTIQKILAEQICTKLLEKEFCEKQNRVLLKNLSFSISG